MVSSAGLASGVLISEDKVLTAAHVVQAVDKVFVEFADGLLVTARVLSSAIQADVALLQLDWAPPDATPARLGDSDQVEVGDKVFVVGAPYGLSPTLSVGHVSGRAAPKNHLTGMSAWEFFQTDAAINGGNSGGPMFNWKGEVIGIVSNILTRSGGFEGIGFAATSKMARLLLEQKPFWSGMEGILIQGNLAAVLNLPQPAGFLVQRVAEGSASWRLGIRPGALRVSIEGSDLLLGGDVILSVNGIDVLEDDAAMDSIYESVSNLKPGERVVARVLRAGRLVELSTVITP
jgi:S1-C subfamily serine protease